ncbi:MAG: peptide deformylase [Patescibacteria group bacterium]|nr:peptide deformylase [Patescibacteria group bacterium]
MVTIVQKDDPILRRIAEPVAASMIGTPALRRMIRDMKEAIASQDDAVAIAAPQIGVSLRIFVVSGKVWDMLATQRESGAPESDDVVFINPEIVKLSKDKEKMEEGCLSVRYLYGKMMRAKKAKIRALNEKGQAFEIGGSGLLAQIFQHETDHLDGKLFIDEATEIEDIPPEPVATAAKKPTPRRKLA